MAEDPQLSDLQPRRNPGLVDRLMGVFARFNRTIGPQEDQRDTSQTGQVLDYVQRLYGQQFTLSYKRLDVYQDCEDMDDQCEEVSVALDTIADNLVTSTDGVQVSFQVTSKDAKVQDVIDRTTQTCDLHQAVRPLARNLVKYGDSFTEPIVNKEIQLVGVKQLPPGTMVRNQDAFGNLMLGRPQMQPDGTCKNEAGECAFEQIDPEEPGKPIATFWPWQIIHTRLNWNGFSAYGRSHLRVTRHAWKKLRALEESMIVGRLTRDYLKLVFHIDTTGLTPRESKDVIRDFKQSVMQKGRPDSKRESPTQVMTDYFMTDGYVKVNGQPMARKTRIEVIDPKNEGLHNIQDIEHLHRKLISTLRVPPAHMGYERDLNAKATLTQQDVQYVRWLRALQQLIGQMLEDIYDFALALEGVDPVTAEYRISWPQLKATDELSAAQSEFNRAQGDQIYLTNGVIDAQWIQENRLDLSQDEITDLQARVEKAQAEMEAKQAAAADDAHQKTLDIVKAKGAGDPLDPVQNKAGGVSVKNGTSKKPRTVRQETRWFYTLLQESRARQAA